MASNFFELNEDFNYPFCNKVSIKSQKNKKIYPRVYGKGEEGGSNRRKGARTDDKELERGTVDFKHNY